MNIYNILFIISPKLETTQTSFSLLLFILSVMSNFLGPHGLQQVSLSFTIPRTCSQSCLLSWLLLLLLELCCFSCVWLCATLWMSAHQASLSLGFSRQEHWSGLPSPSPMYESEKWKWSCSIVSDSQWPHGLQPTRFLCPGIFQARVLEWGVFAFSNWVGNAIQLSCLLLSPSTPSFYLSQHHF